MTLSIERLREIAADGFLGHGENKAMASELIAIREQQSKPSGYLYTYKTSEGITEHISIEKLTITPDERNRLEVVVDELFTASQKPLSSPVGEIVAWSGTNRDMGITRDIDFRFFRFDVLPGTKLYAAEPVPMVTDEMALAFHFATTDGAAGDDDVEDIKIGLMAALSAAPKRGGEQAPAVKSDLLTRAEALAVETRALATRIQDGE